MTKWDKYGIHSKLETILASTAINHNHGVRDYLDAYQLAIEFAKKNPKEFASLGKPIGGKGTGQRNSLSEYIAGQLSKRIKAGTITNIEIAYVADLHVVDKEYSGKVISSLTGMFSLSMYRLRD